MQIRVAIADDHPLAIAGISMMLNIQQEIKIVAAYNTAAALMEGLRNDQPDVLLLDIRLPDQSGHEVAAVIAKTYPDVRIVVLTSLDAPNIAKGMIEQGCLGYLLKDTSKETLITAIHHAYRWESFIEPSIKQHMLWGVLKKEQPGICLELTKREKEVLELIVNGDTTQQMADKLFISPRTAESHRLTLLKKLDVKNTAGLVRMATMLGLV